MQSFLRTTALVSTPCHWSCPSHFTDWETQAESLNNLPKVTQLLSSRVRTQKRILGPQDPCSEPLGFDAQAMELKRPGWKIRFQHLASLLTPLFPSPTPPLSPPPPNEDDDTYLDVKIKGNYKHQVPNIVPCIPNAVDGQ